MPPLAWLGRPSFPCRKLNLQLAHLRSEPALVRLQGRVTEIASLLEKKESIPLVAKQMDLILEIQADDFWTHITLLQLESVRKKLRDLVKFIDKKQQPVIYTDFEDEIGTGTELLLTPLASTVDVEQYRKKVKHFLKKHEDEPAVLKLKINKPLTPADLHSLESLLYDLGGEGTREQFIRAYGEPESLGAFVRRLVGLDREAAKAAFGQYLQNTTYNANQIRFLNQIIDYLTQNGVMDTGLLFEPPFDSFHKGGLSGLFEDTDARGIIGMIDLINRNAGATGIVATG